MITKNIIGFDLSSKSGKEIFAFDPDKMIQLPEAFSTASTTEVNEALEKAQAAWRVFRNMESKQKASFLTAIASGIEDLGDTLVHRMMQETAYNEARVLTERNRTCAQLRMYAAILQREEWRDIAVVTALPERSPVPGPDLRKMNMAIGPVIVFAASNFPLAYSTAGGDTTSALAAGCPVIVKAHESHLGTNALVAEAIMNAAKSTGMPDGVFSSLNGDGILTGQQLVMHPLTAGVGFTGSLAGGRALFDLGQKREKPIPVFTEMGSVNPIFLLPGKVKADKENISTMLVNSITNSLGQFCTKPGLLFFIDGEETQQLILRLEELFQNIPSGSMLNENIAGNYKKGIAAVKMESDVVISPPFSADQKLKGQPLLATVHADKFPANPKLHHEVFGPFSMAVLCKDFKQMQETAEALEGQLTATVHATEEEAGHAKQLIQILVEKAGRIIYNGVPTGVEVCAAMTHGGPYPASSDSRFTAVGDAAIRRWLRPVTFQNFPVDLLPKELMSVT